MKLHRKFSRKSVLGALIVLGITTPVLAITIVNTWTELPYPTMQYNIKVGRTGYDFTKANSKKTQTGPLMHNGEYVTAPIIIDPEEAGSSKDRKEFCRNYKLDHEYNTDQFLINFVNAIVEYDSETFIGNYRAAFYDSLVTSYPDLADSIHTSLEIEGDKVVAGEFYYGDKLVNGVYQCEYGWTGWTVYSFAVNGYSGAAQCLYRCKLHPYPELFSGTWQKVDNGCGPANCVGIILRGCFEDGDEELATCQD